MESKELEHFYWLECTKCGKSQKGLINATRAPEPKPPVCKVCGGKGYTVVQVPADSVPQQPQNRTVSVNEFLDMADEERGG